MVVFTWDGTPWILSIGSFSRTWKAFEQLHSLCEDRYPFIVLFQFENISIAKVSCIGHCILCPAYPSMTVTCRKICPVRHEAPHLWFCPWLFGLYRCASKASSISSSSIQLVSTGGTTSAFSQKTAQIPKQPPETPEKLTTERHRDILNRPANHHAKYTI